MQKYIVDTTGKDQGQISKATTRIRSSGGVTQTLLRMALWFGRIKLDCADTVQVRGDKKQPPFYSYMSCSHIFCEKGFANFYASSEWNVIVIDGRNMCTGWIVYILVRK